MAEGKNWYIVNTYSGHENKVKDNIVRRIDSLNMQDYIFRVLVAEYEEPVVKDGVFTGKMKMKNMFPGYIFVEMIMTDEAWYVVRNTPGVTGLMGSSGKGTKPFPVTDEEMENVLKRVGMSEAGNAADFEVGDCVRIVNGPFAEQVCTVDSIDSERRTLNVKTVIFAQERIIPVSVDDVQKV